MDKYDKKRDMKVCAWYILTHQRVPLNFTFEKKASEVLRLFGQAWHKAGERATRCFGWF